MANFYMNSGVSTYVGDAADYINSKIRISGITYYDVNYCGEGALYYLNSMGGYDAFLIEGACVRTDKFSQKDVYKAYDNAQVNDFGRKRFLTQITPTWKLTTGWLTDDESKRLADNLLPSTQVWFHNLAENTIHPVVITDSQVKHKTYSNEGYQLVSYDINIEYSQPMERR